MAEKDPAPYPLVPANGRARSDEESVTAAHSAELRKKKRMKCIAYVVAFAVFQTIIIAVFALTVMRIKSPKFRVREASFLSTFDVTNASFNLAMDTQFTVKNTNFGHFKYDYGSVTFAYKGMAIGETQIGEARVRARSTKKVNAIVTLSANNLPSNSGLSFDLGLGLLRLTSYSKLDGKVQLMKVIKKKKSAQMDCSMEINLRLRTIQNLQCM
uniref:Late embryogenesis abundant protein LEA-2 subgroup domain-containing protein n=1 Tax=Fagus sylvatica TaxID=28930 RepID=A0A2N9ED43_FAGSY